MQKWDNNFVSSSVKTSGRLVIMMVLHLFHIFIFSAIDLIGTKGYIESTFSNAQINYI